MRVCVYVCVCTCVHTQKKLLKSLKCVLCAVLLHFKICPLSLYRERAN